MKHRIINIVLLGLTLCALVSVSFGWWIEATVTDSFLIQSANISSTVTVYKGLDFNYDGNLDKTEGEDTYVEVLKTEKGTKQIVVLDFRKSNEETLGSLLPNEIHTWKITVNNKGDASGYVYATIHEMTAEQKLMVKYMSLTYDGIKTYLYDAVNDSTKIVFGGDYERDVVKIQTSKDFVIQIQLESFDDLVKNRVITGDIEEARKEYQSLQGKVFYDDSFEFLDVSLSG